VIAPPKMKTADGLRFRTKLFVAMVVLVSAMTAVVLFVTQRNAAAAVEQELQRAFQSELAALQSVQELRHAALVERCRTLVRRPRIHAALEDDALDLLYPSAKDELRDLMVSDAGPSTDQARYGLHAEFYRFLDRNGAVIHPENSNDVGWLEPQEEAQLALPSVQGQPQLGYITRNAQDDLAAIVEIIAMPIFSTETGEPIATIVLGFKPAAFASARAESGIKRGLWLKSELHLDSVSLPEKSALSAEVTRAISLDHGMTSSFGHEIGNPPHLLFFKRVNEGSTYPPAFEVCIYPLAGLRERERQLRWSVLGGGSLLLLVAFGASHVIAGKLSGPVEKLVVDSAENLAQRERAEARLEATSEELQRAARFSADASHQLKTPVTVLRAGLEELLSHEKLTAEECHEISGLIHQTHRLSGVIEDLLLLSKMDAGRLKIEFRAVNLSHLIEAALDDLSAQPDAFHLSIETDFPSALHVAGEERYISLILQNLLENARKYNRTGGLVRISVRQEAGLALMRVANSGRPISAEAQEHIFERFHRGAMGENVPGYGLGLNLAREMARLHGGDLCLLRSDAELTEFEVRFLTTGAGDPAREVLS
jgi:signal transduction histidine kinase